MKNIIVIGEDVDDIAMDLWKMNTNYTVLNSNPYLWSGIFRRFIDHRPVIVATNHYQFKQHDINSVLSKLQELDFVPVLISDNEKDFVNEMYTVLNDTVEGTVLWKRNNEKKDYNELLSEIKPYLFERQESDDTVIPTPKTRKRSTTKK